ncbi:molybdenum cofactor guanylyltransferase [Noviluteimonas gilva]|uniref:NTP transferase domain-containing protein n=1 Tax=Noviluteimonas gilva TaxID=2682097 RepID=A0A7C9M459_9GAMM|nr:NTP transferase domain-containing protein [Lysobacter gilvus]
MIAPRAITLGILAGGRGTRLGGIDKAWIVRDGIAQVQRLAKRFDGEVSQVLVSANRDLERFQALGFIAVADRTRDLGPIGGLDALAHACTTQWLLTIPVDLVFVNDCLIPTLGSAGGQGASIEDEDGPQPLVALWNVEALRNAPFQRDDLSVQSLQTELAMPRIRLDGVRFGNLNTPEDLAAAHATLP